MPENPDGIQFDVRTALRTEVRNYWTPLTPRTRIRCKRLVNSPRRLLFIESATYATWMSWCAHGPTSADHGNGSGAPIAQK